MKVVILAPIPTSLYARLVTHLLAQEEGIDVAGIVVRTPWDLKRILSEFKRDGARLFNKFIQKIILREKRYKSIEKITLRALSESMNLPSGSLKSLAHRYKIPLLVVRNLNQSQSQRFLGRLKPDVIAFTGGGLIRSNILSIPRLGILNCHTGLLPQFRGMDVVEWTAAEGEIGHVGFGVTLHLMDKGLDTGPILLRKKMEAKPGDTFHSIRTRLEVQMVKMMVAGVRGLRDRKLKPIPQNLNRGKQYFVMHPRMAEFAEKKLRTYL